MPSPFPGMDPYLENPSIWMDFHESFITYCRDALNERLPDAYETRIEERINLVELPAERVRSFRADIAVSAASDSHGPGAAGSSHANGGNVATIEPVTIPLVFYEVLSESKVHVLHRDEQRLVTVIELLSPTNKSGEGFHLYKSKRNAIVCSRVNLVEIDLLLGGQRVELQDPLPAGDYFAFVARGNRRPDCDVFGWSVRSPLPSLPIPLLSPDPDLQLDLQELFATTYDRGRYRRSLRYADSPVVPLAKEDLDWAAALGKGVSR
jgi:hypothetical protein